MEELQIHIQLQKKQMEAYRLSLTTPVFFYGGAKGGGKSYLVRAREILRRLSHKGSKGLIIRKTLPELRANHIQPLLKEYPIIANQKWLNKSEKIIYYPNGSITEFSYLQSTNDVYTYQGREYDDISIDEITQHEEEVYKILRSSLRTTIPGLLPTMFLTGNPGGPGHQWVKRLFIDKSYRPDEMPSDYAFMQAFLKDNKKLTEADPAYEKRLENLPDHLRRAYLFGDWNIFAGLAFSELSEATHVIDPISLPQYTTYFGGFDYGYNHPFAFVLCAISPDGEMYVVSQVIAREKSIKEIAQAMKDTVAGRDCVVAYGHDIKNKKDSGPTILEQLQAELSGSSIRLVEAKIDRIQGVARIRHFITIKDRVNGQPILKFFKNTLPTYSTVLAMQYDGSNPEDVVKTDADENGEGGDDLYDAFRYALMQRAKAHTPILPKPTSQLEIIYGHEHEDNEDYL